MTKEHIQSLFRQFALVSAIFFSVAGSVAAVDTESRTIFTAPVTGDEEASVRNAEAALHLGTFNIPSSQGRITFLDETPLAQTPSISIVVVENSEFSTLADARYSGASALELFVAFAPPRTKIPERLNLYTNLLRAGGFSADAEAKAVTTLRLHGTPALPDVGKDNWGAGSCAVKEDWDAGFTAWVISNSFQLGWVGLFGSSNDSVYVPHATQTHGYFGFNDAIWVGVCMRTGGGMMHVGMQYRNSDGNWVTVGGWGSLLTKADLHVGERYLYRSFKPYTAPRRVYVSSTNEDEASGGDGNTAFISGKWMDFFEQDSTKAAP